MKTSSITRRRFVAGTAGIAATVCGGPLFAAGYPERPIQLVVPFAAGGSVDFIARELAVGLAPRMPAGVVVVNRAGASATIGTRQIAQAAPDGYTLGLINIAHAANAALGALPYDSVKDFAPIELVTRIPSMLLAHESLPVNSITELIALAKSKPDTLTFGSVGQGTSNHLPMALLMHLTGARMVHVPYSSTGTFNAELLGGQIQLGFTTVPTGLGRLKTGKVKALGVASVKRLAVLPDVPAIGETVPGFEFTDWHAVVAPAGTPGDIGQRLNAEITRVLALPAFVDRVREQGAEIVGGTQQQLSAYLTEEIAKWTRVLQTPGLDVKKS